MSNISRRKFLKGAGVAALAVAAAGVLAGCSDKNTPSVGEDREIKLIYMATSEGKILDEVTIKVPALAGTVSFATIQENKPAAAEGYEFDSTEDKKIPADGNVGIKMTKKAPEPTEQEVQVKYVLVQGTGPVELNGTDKRLMGAKFTVTAKIGAEAIDTTGLLPATSELRIAVGTELPEGVTKNGVIENGKATVYVKKA